MTILQEEHDRLLLRHNKVLQDAQDKDDQYRKRMDEVNKDKLLYNKELHDSIQQLTNQNESLTVSYKEQIKGLHEDQRRALDLLQRQLDSSENDNIRLQRELQHASRLLLERQSPETFQTVQGTEFIPDMRHEERQEGEGSEIVDPEPCTKGGSKLTPSPMPLDKLLTVGPEDTASKIGQPVDEVILQENLTTANKRLEHTTELLNESEAALMRLTEQAKILKEEIRRLERNQEREKEAANMEYLKNILLKFLSLKVGDDRQKLIPVLCTMLKLSPEEKALLDAVAQGEDTGQAQQAQGWGSYLHRWSGLAG